MIKVESCMLQHILILLPVNHWFEKDGQTDRQCVDYKCLTYFQEHNKQNPVAQ